MQIFKSQRSAAEAVACKLVELTSPVRKRNTHANIEVGGTGAALTQKLFWGAQLLLALVFTIITGKVSSVNSLVSFF